MFFFGFVYMIHKHMQLHVVLVVGNFLFFVGSNYECIFHEKYEIAFENKLFEIKDVGYLTNCNDKMKVDVSSDGPSLGR